MEPAVQDKTDMSNRTDIGRRSDMNSSETGALFTTQGNLRFLNTSMVLDDGTLIGLGFGCAGPAQIAL